MYCAVLIVRLEVRLQVEQLNVSNETLKSNNEALSADVVRLSQAVQHVSDVLSKYFLDFSVFLGFFSVVV